MSDKITILRSNVASSFVGNELSSNTEIPTLNGSGRVGVEESSLINSNVANNINQTNNYNIYPSPSVSDFVILIEALANSFISKSDEDEKAQLNMEAREKIKYNNLDEKKRIIEEYGTHYGSIEDAKKILADKDPFLFEKCIELLHSEYLNAVKNLELQEIRERSSAVWDLLKNSLEKKGDPQKPSMFAIEILLSYAFVRCRIFEKIV